MNIPFMSVEASLLVTQVLIASLEVVGIIQWLKGYFPKIKKKSLVTLCLVFSIGCGGMNSHLVSSAGTTLFNVIAMTLAVSQLGWTVITNTILKALDGIIQQKAGITNSIKNNELGQGDNGYHGQ